MNIAESAFHASPSSATHPKRLVSIPLFFPRLEIKLIVLRLLGSFINSAGSERETKQIILLYFPVRKG